MQKIFDRFEYSETDIIGVGGMGTVYRGKDTTANGRLVAIKYLKPEIVQSNPAMVDRFRREGEALRDLNHPNIVQMLDAGMCDNHHYIVMEFVPGGSLRDLLDHERKLNVQRVLYIALDMADALTRAHRLDILHRDIKPGNVLIAADGTPRLTDFGVARTKASHLTDDGQIIGTMAYISPEALTGGDLDERHDIWAFGVMLFEMLAGRRPFPSENIGQLVTEITQQPIPDLEQLRPDAPVALVDLIYRMLDRKLQTRIRSARLVGAELEQIIYSGGAENAPVGLSAREAGGDRFRTTITSQQVLNTPTIADPHNAPVGLVNVPTQATAFVGRQREVEEIREQLLADGVRLLTLVGPGGVGKTRIALAVAEAVQAAFPDGVYFVPLAAVERGDMVPMKIAEAIGFQFSGSDNPMEEMIAYIRNKRALIVMDNMEHLMSGAGELARNMEQAPYFKMLVTSRERLRLRGEYAYEVDGLIIPPPTVKQADDLLGYPAARLFMSSAQRVAPGFDLDDETAPHVIRIIQRVQGIPLGIELAAGWLEMLPIEEIATEIENSLDFLETDIRDMPERHRSIRAVFDYSWNLMTEAERETFMKLSVFRGGFGRAAAQKVTGASLRALTGLVNKSLLSRSSDGRYTVAKLLRQYAEEQFFEQYPNTDEVFDAYVENYTVFVEKIKNAFGTARDMQAMDAVDVEIENIRHTLKLVMDRVMLDHIVRLTMPLNQYFFARSMLVEAVTLLVEMRDKLAASGNRETLAHWQTQALLASVLGRRGDYIQAEAMAREVVDTLRSLDEKDDNLRYGMAYTLNQLAYAQMMLGQYDAARASTHEAIDITKSHEDDWDVVMPNALGNLGYLEFLAGNLDEARRIYEDLTNTFYGIEVSPVGYAFTRNNLGEIVQAQGEYESAQLLYQEAYAVFKQYRHLRGMAFSANNLAGCHTMRGEYEQAHDLYYKAYKINQEIGDRAGLGNSLSAMANIALYEQNYREALTYFQRSLDLRREIRDRVGYTRNLTQVGMVSYMLGRAEDARPYYVEAQQLAEEIDNDFLRALAGLGTGTLQLSDGELGTAMKTFRNVLRLMEKNAYSDTATMFVLSSVGIVLTERGLYDKAGQIVGFVEAQAAAPAKTNDEFEPIIRPMLQNVERELQHRLGPGFERARAQGRALGLKDVMQVVFTA